ncbi:MAG: S-layer homology domain-containing protein [Chloroflexi bacterium]|nr:S-layer homology domain-containing protein [Chloroflexota bacterium]
MGGKYSWAEGYGIAVDAAGNIYTTGHFVGTVDFDPGPGKANLTFTSSGAMVSFVSKLDANGNYVLAKITGSSMGTLDAHLLAIVVDTTGNIYTAGNFAGVGDFDPGTGEFNLDCSYPGAQCGFLSKLDGNGNFVLAEKVATGIKAITLDSGNNILATGYDAVLASSYHSPSFPFPMIDYIVIFKFDNNGNIIWENEMGAQQPNTAGGIGKSIAVDISDNVYVTGAFIGTLDFDPGPGVYTLTSAGDSDIFISKWDSNGNLVLAKGMGGDSYDGGSKIAVDTQGNMFTIGSFTGTVDFDPGPGTANLTSHTGGYDIFVSKLDGDIIPPIFTDVPFSNWANTYIERLYNAGVTGGCSTNPMKYCPTVTVTRDQMAVFLLRGEHGSAYTPPAATGTTFADVPADYWAADWIEQLANEGITGGCGNGDYCPTLPVTRDQMAVFLLRGEHGGSYTPPAATGLFSDVPNAYWAVDWIEQLANEGITGGCGNGNYCPSTPVTRDQMAVFLVRAFSLP